MTDDRDDADEARDDDPMMRSMRSVWLSMREEEPPQGGLAELMAAARTKAVDMAPKESWWQRVFATLRRPPVLAMATVVLLVGGAVLIGKRQSDLKVDEMAPAGPTVSRTAGETTTLEPIEEAPPAEPAATANAGSGTVGADHGAAPPVVRRQNRKPRGPLGKPDPIDRMEGTKLEAGGGAPGDPRKERGTESGETDQATATDDAEQPPRSAPTTRAPEAQADVSRPTTIAQLVEQSAAAAARGDCATVKAMSARIRKLSPAVYNEQLAKNAAIAKCLRQ